MLLDGTGQPVGIGYGYIDKTGAVAIKPQFDWAYNVSEGLAPVETGFGSDFQISYIDKTGKVIWQGTR